MASVAPTVTSTSVSGSYSMPKCRLRWAAMASRSGAMPSPGGYWLTPSAMAFSRGLQHRRRAVLVGEALPEVHRADARGQRRHLGEDRDRVGLQPRHRHGRPSLGVAFPRARREAAVTLGVEFVQVCVRSRSGDRHLPTNRLAEAVRLADRGLPPMWAGLPTTPFANRNIVMSEEAFIYEAIRTPRGKNKNGALNEVKPINLVVGLIDELRTRFPDLDENLISDVILGVRLARRRPGRRHRPHRGAGGRAARHHRRRAAQPVLRLGPRGRQHRRAEGALRLGRPGAGRRRRVDEPRADGLRRRRMGHRPGDQLHDRLRAAGHRRRPDRHHRGLLPRGRRRLRAALAGEGRRRRGRAATSPSPSCRSATRTAWSSSTTTSTCGPTPPWRAWAS